MDRRSFIKLTAISGTSATLAACGSPENQIIRFVPDEEIVPGIATWKPSVCPLCAAGCGLTVRVMEADVETMREGQRGVVRKPVAKKLEGNREHPVNGGGLCARGQAAIQLTYHPDRITQPLKRSGARGTGAYEAIAWEAALAELASRIDANRANVAALIGPARSQRQVLMNRFLSALGSPGATVFDPFGDAVLRRANALSFGRDQLPTIDLARTHHVLSFGADFLGTWGSVVAQSAAYGVMRSGRPNTRGSFVQVESRMSQTGANADQWIAVKPGTEGVLALGLARAIMAGQPGGNGGRAGAAIAGWSAGLPDYTPDAVEKMTGVRASRVESLARDFAERRPAVAIVGGAALAHTNGLFSALAVNALNALVGATEQPGGIFFTPQPESAASVPGFRLSPEGGGRPLAEAQVLLVDGANPVFSAPPGWQVRETIEKLPYIVSFGAFLDETSGLADLILPDHTFLEAWADAAPESGALVGVRSVAPPVMKPLYDTRATGDVLLDVGRRLQQPLNLPWPSYEEMLRSSFEGLPAADGGDAWTTAQTQGGWWGALPSRPQAAATSAAPVAYQPAVFDGDPQQYPFHLLPYSSAKFLDGALAHLPWLQEMPDPITTAMWSSWIEINPKAAVGLGISTGDIVEVVSAHGSLRVPAYVSPGIAPDVVAMPLGQGHTDFTRYATGRGQNPSALLAPLTEPATGALAWAATRVKVTRAAAADGSLILFAGEQREHQEHGR